MHETQADGADEIAAVLASGSRGDIVVLARTTILLRTIALGCSALGVRIAAPEQVFEPAGARGALEAYVRLCADPTDADAADVARVCRAPGRGLPLDAQEQVAASLRAGGSFTEGFATVAVAARQRIEGHAGLVEPRCAGPDHGRHPVRPVPAWSGRAR